MAEARETPSQQQSVGGRDEPPTMQITDWLRLLLRETDTGARLDRMNALLTASTNEAMRLRDLLPYVQMAVDHAQQQSNADLDTLLQQMAVIETLKMKKEEQDKKISELELEVASQEECNENGKLVQLVNSLDDLINEARRSGFSIRKSLYFYTGPYGSDSFKLQIYYGIVLSDRGFCLQFGLHVKAGPRDQRPFSKKMSIRIYGIENGNVAGSIGVEFTPPVALYPQLSLDGTGPFWIEQFLNLSEIQQVVKDNSFLLSVKVESDYY